jgi:hypothetical protein
MSIGERVSWFLSLLGAVLVAAPFVSDDYQHALGDGAFALMFAGGIMGLTAFIAVFLLRSRNRHRRNLVAGRDLLIGGSLTSAKSTLPAAPPTRPRTFRPCPALAENGGSP